MTRLFSTLAINILQYQAADQSTGTLLRASPPVLTLKVW